MSSRSEELAKDPEANGFSFAGWTVRLPDGRYIREWRILNPRPGIVAMTRDTEAMTLPTPRSAANWRTASRATLQRCGNPPESD